MNNRIDEPAHELAQSTTRRRALMQFSAGLTGLALLALNPANAPTQPLVPLIVVPNASELVFNVPGAPNPYVYPFVRQGNVPIAGWREPYEQKSIRTN